MPNATFSALVLASSLRSWKDGVASADVFGRITTFHAPWLAPNMRAADMNKHQKVFRQA